MGIRWEDPPPQRTGRGSGKWQAIVQPLREHPKRWAILACFPTCDQAANIAVSLRSGVRKTGPGRFEFAARTVDGEHRIYGRYLGPDDQDGGS